MNKFLHGIIASTLAIALVGCNESNQQSNVTIVKSPQSATPKASDKQPTSKWSWLNGVDVQPYTDTNLLLNKNYVIVFDGSGSMGGERLKIAKQAAKAFTQKVTNDDLIGLVVFDYNDTGVRVPLSLNNKQTFNQAIDNINDGGGTPLESALNYAYVMMQQQGAKQRGYGEYHIVVITDGEASMGEDPRDIVRHIAQHSPINIHSIGFQFEGDHSLNQKEYTSYYQADDYNGLISSFSNILAESTDFDAATFN